MVERQVYRLCWTWTCWNYIWFLLLWWSTICPREGAEVNEKIWTWYQTLDMWNAFLLFSCILRGSKTCDEAAQESVAEGIIRAGRLAIGARDSKAVHAHLRDVPSGAVDAHAGLDSVADNASASHGVRALPHHLRVMSCFLRKSVSSPHSLLWFYFPKKINSGWSVLISTKLQINRIILNMRVTWWLWGLHELDLTYLTYLKRHLTKAFMFYLGDVLEMKPSGLMTLWSMITFNIRLYEWSEGDISKEREKK